MQKEIRINHLRRILLPFKYRTDLNIGEGTLMEISIEYGKLHIKPFENSGDICSRPHIGMVRYVDSVGRVVIPAEYVYVLGWKIPCKASVEVKEREVIVQKMI